MAIFPNCNKCSRELLEFGAILLSPPDIHNRVIKFHLCKNCYSELLKELKLPGAKASE
jgi:hypothetical protein